jgi:hypothetical protein
MTSVFAQPRRRLSRDERELLRMLVSDARRKLEEGRKEGRHNDARRSPTLPPFSERWTKPNF